MFRNRSPENYQNSFNVTPVGCFPNHGVGFTKRARALEIKILPANRLSQEAMRPPASSLAATGATQRPVRVAGTAHLRRSSIASRLPVREP